MNQIGLSEFYRGKYIFLTGSTGILNVRKMKYFFKGERKEVQGKQDRFLTCFKTCGTGSPILRGGEWVQSP